jgi:hypothetical protein
MAPGAAAASRRGGRPGAIVMPASRKQNSQAYLDVVAGGDRREMEALELEIRRLAREHGVEVERLDIAPAPPRRAVSARRRAPRRRG